MNVQRFGSQRATHIEVAAGVQFVWCILLCVEVFLIPRIGGVHRASERLSTRPAATPEASVTRFAGLPAHPRELLAGSPDDGERSLA